MRDRTVREVKASAVNNPVLCLTLAMIAKTANVTTGPTEFQYHEVEPKGHFVLPSMFVTSAKYKLAPVYSSKIVASGDIIQSTMLLTISPRY